MTAAQFRAIRERAGLSQAALAALIATSRNTIARYEREDGESARPVPGTAAVLMRLVDEGVLR
jgi:transcriptional regulator with XRE-family HTH domain